MRAPQSPRYISRNDWPLHTALRLSGFVMAHHACIELVTTAILPMNDLWTSARSQCLCCV
jgi:hypothetical protein